MAYDTFIGVSKGKVHRNRNTIKSRLLNRTLQNLLGVEDTFVEPPQVQGNQKEGSLAWGIVHRTTFPNILTSFVSFNNSCSETAF